eukprot:CAMPEP_0178442760 /NCGR_PEP_ID=MMETSP0689_2-20121128/38396_1 /TAXON_ID=160604 /ORGANISM="Amphidinium massartii, Strain CS-259" /LENGTH=66 /DNA_ID=CAMNT_0020066447 /DNA_START=331 /DNA_END=531 /DNA_ORIENTATION=+
MGIIIGIMDSKSMPLGALHPMGPVPPHISLLALFMKPQTTQPQSPLGRLAGKAPPPLGEKPLPPLS